MVKDAEQREQRLERLNSAAQERVRRAQAGAERVRRRWEFAKLEAAICREREWAKARILELETQGLGPTAISDALYSEKAYRVSPSSVGHHIARRRGGK